MKRTILLAGLLLVLTAPAALAAGVNFNWGTVCYTEAPLAATTFACTANTGSWQMVASMVIDTEMLDYVGVEILIEGQADTPTLPDWWQVGSTTGDCRLNKSSFVSNFSTAPQVSCMDWTAGQAFNVYGMTWDTNRGHISAGAALDASTPFDMLPGVEYYAGQITVLNSKAVGTGACAGCSTGFKWGLYSLVAAGLAGRRDLLTVPISGGNQCLSWNGSTVACASPLPARATTWGQIKSLYR